MRTNKPVRTRSFVTSILRPLMLKRTHGGSCVGCGVQHARLHEKWPINFRLQSEGAEATCESLWLRYAGCDDVDRIRLTWDKIQLCVLMNTLVKLRISQQEGHFLKRRPRVSVSRTAFRCITFICINLLMHSGYYIYHLV